MTIAILGANGQLGQAFLRALGDDAVGLTRAQLDLERPETFSQLDALRPEAVINCTAYNLVDKAETDTITPYVVNAVGVRALAETCARLGCELIHYSTNFVFGLDRDWRVPYGETDLPGPLGVYGASKLTGEYLVRSTCPKHFVIRTCGLFGRVSTGTGRRSFVELMLELARRGQPIRVVNDQVCAPTLTDDLVHASLALLRTRAYGLYHLTSAGECSWHDFARTIFDLAHVTANLQGIASADFAAPAQRPEYSTLGNFAYARLGLPLIRHWRDALASYLPE